MATYTTYTDGTNIAAGSGGNYAGSPCRTVLTGTYDATRRNTTAADVIEVLNIPAGTVVENVVLEVITIEATATPTIAVGDGGGTTSWVGATSTATAAKTLGAGAYVVAGGKFYAAADTIDLVIPAGDAATTLVCKVHAICSIV